MNYMNYLPAVAGICAAIVCVAPACGQTAGQDEQAHYNDLAEKLLAKLPESASPHKLCVLKFSPIGEQSKSINAQIVASCVEAALSRSPKVKMLTRNNLEQLDTESAFQQAFGAEGGSEVKMEAATGLVRGGYQLKDGTFTILAEIVMLKDGSVVKERASWAVNGVPGGGSLYGIKEAVESMKQALLRPKSGEVYVYDRDGSVTVERSPWPAEKSEAEEFLPQAMMLLDGTQAITDYPFIAGILNAWCKTNDTAPIPVKWLETFVAAGADVNAEHATWHTSPLEIAANYNQVEACKFLLAHGADMHRGGRNKALRDAREAGYQAVVDVLLADASATQEDRGTATEPTQNERAKNTLMTALQNVADDGAPQRGEAKPEPAETQQKPDAHIQGKADALNQLMDEPIGAIAALEACMGEGLDIVSGIKDKASADAAAAAVSSFIKRAERAGEEMEAATERLEARSEDLGISDMSEAERGQFEALTATADFRAKVQSMQDLQASINGKAERMAELFNELAEKDYYGSSSLAAAVDPEHHDAEPEPEPGLDDDAKPEGTPQQAEQGASSPIETQSPPQSAPQPAPVQYTSTEDRSDLQPLLNRMAALKCKHADSAEQQRHLLVLLPMIRDGASVDVTTPDSFGHTALHYSSAIGSLSITRWLVNHGANVNAVADNGDTPLSVVGSDNRAAITSLLKQHGAGSGGTSYTPASAPASVPTAGGGELQSLINRVSSMSTHDATIALYKKRLMMLLPMIQNGADVDTTTVETKGNTALHYACGLGDDALVLWLLQHGANPNAVTNKGKTPTQCSSSPSVQRLLKQYGGH